MAWSRTIGLVALAAALVMVADTSALANGGKSKRLRYSAEVPLGGGVCRFDVELEPLLFGLRSMGDRYRVARMTIRNSGDRGLVLSPTADRIDNAHCSGLPAGAFRESRISANELFQFSPRRHAMKAAILAAHLTPRSELLLFNCFGPRYVAVAGHVLSLEWLRTGRVRDNLERVFGVKVQG